MQRSRSIRTHLVILVAAVALPLGAMEAWSVYAQFRTELGHAEREALYLAEGIAANVQQYLRDAEDVADNLASWMGEGGFERACGGVLPVAAQVITQFDNLIVADRAGAVRCAARVPDATLPNLTDQEWFHRAVSFETPVLSGLAPDPVSGDWAAAMGFPLRDESGDLIGAVGGLLATHHLVDLLEPLSLPEGTVVTVFDDRHTVVARSADHDRWLGRRLPMDDVAETVVSPGRKLTRAQGLDGVDRTWGSVTLDGTGWQISAGLPRAAITGPLAASALRKGITSLLVVALVVILAFSLYRRIVRALQGLVRRTRAGAQAPAPTLPPDGPREVLEVCRQFDQALEDRSRAEAAEREAKERYRSILENAIFGIYVSTRDGRFREANPALANMLGYESPEALKGAHLQDIYVDPEEREELVRQHRHRRVIDHVEVDWRRADGEIITVRLCGTAVRAGPNGDRAFEVIVEDITEQRAMEEQYRHTQKMEAVGRLAGGVAHDFNNLLTVMIGQTRLLMSEVPEGHSVRDSAQEVLDAGERAAGLTRQLLAFSRKESARARPTELNQVVENLQRMLGRLIGEDISLETRLAPDLNRVLVDAGQIEQVLMNLVVNARDAMPAGGRILIETANRTLDGELGSAHVGIDRGDYVLLRVSDTGAGVPQELHTRVFEPFFTTKAKGLGTGLGLSTVYGIVTQNRGEISVRSQPGQGAAFEILLPRYMGPAEPEPCPEEPADPVSGAETVLVVEDEAPVRSVVTRVLERAGYAVLAAESGQEALEVVADHDDPIHMTVTDIVMPGMKGTELADRLSRARPESGLLFISGYSDTPDLERWTQEDPSVLLAKPFTPRELQDRVAERIRAHAERTATRQAG